MKKLFMLIACCCLLEKSVGQLVPVCTLYNVTVSSGIVGETPFIADVVYSVSAGSIVSGSGTVNKNLITKSQVEYIIQTDNVPNISISKSVEITNSDIPNPQVKIGTVINHNDDASFAYIKDVTFNDDLSLGLWAQLGDGFIPGILEPGVSNTDRAQIRWNVEGNITVNGSRTFEYLAEPAGADKRGLPDGVSLFSTLIQFTDSTNVKYATAALDICIDRTTVLQSSLFYQHGFTALSFFMAFLLGILLVVLIVFIVVFLMKKKGLMASAISPTKLDQRKLKETGKKIVLDAKDALKRGFNTIKDYSLIGPDDSIIHVLALRDKLQMFREIDNLDILSTIHVDTNIEKEQNDAATQAGLMIIHGMQQNNDISKQTEDKVVSNYNNNIKKLEKKLDDDYKKEMELILIRLCARNKEKVGEMLNRHNLEKEEVEDRSSDLSEKESKEFLEILEKQHQTEQNEMTYVLALEQNEEAEKLRKEFGIRKRMGIKEVQQMMIQDVIQNGNLTEQQADWLIKEHKRQQEAIQQMYDEEISRQRMTLEEKLARRRALAQASELQEDDQRDMLNTMAGHQVADINKLQKQNKLTSELAEDMIEDVKKDMLAVKEKMEKEKERQQNELHKKLSLLKQEKLSGMRKQQEGELVEYDKRCKEQQSSGIVDPISLLGGFLKLRSSHRAELLFAELELDNDHSKQLEKARDIIAERTKDELYLMEKLLLEKLQAEGMKDADVTKIIKQHEREVAELCESQEEQRRRQQEKLMEELSRRKKEWDQRRMSEKKEQEELREHEARVIGKLINSQMSISEEDRLKIMKEHEQHMIKLENSLTLNKLRQKRMLEERLALKRAQQMDKLQQKQQGEVQKQRQKFINNGEEEDEESHKKEIELMKKHAEQRLCILNGQMLNIDEELDEIRIEMVRERAISLKNQEERLGTMIARLQLDKAKELTTIEEQQKAINSLKLNLVDDLNERGMISSPECEKLVDRHKQQKEELVRKLDEQRTKQEKALRKKLGERVQLREQSMVKQQEVDMQNMTNLSGNKMAAKFKRMMLMHKQLIELERFRNQMDREITQTLEDTKRQYQLQKSNAVQKQEFEFIAKLVKFSQIKKEEVVDVIQILFPRKTSEEKHQLLVDLYDDSPLSKTTSPEQEELLRSSGPSTLPQRIQRTSISGDSDRSPSRAVSRKGGNSFNRKKKKVGRKESTYSLLDSLDPATLGSVVQSDYKRLHDENSFMKSSRKNSTKAQEDFLRGNPDGYDSDNIKSRISKPDFMKSSIKHSRPRDDFNRSNHDAYDSDNYKNNHSDVNNIRKNNKHRSSSDDLHSSGYYDNYGRQYDEDDDYLQGSLSNNKSTGPMGRLPPLQPIKASTTRTKKKKKHLLQKMAHRDEDSDGYL